MQVAVTPGDVKGAARDDRRGDDDYYDRFRGRVMFPIRDATGRVVGFSGRVLDPAASPAKYINSPETPLFHKGRILYALDLARASIVRNPRREAIVCEGSGIQQNLAQKLRQAGVPLHIVRLAHQRTQRSA